MRGGRESIVDLRSGRTLSAGVAARNEDQLVYVSGDSDVHTMSTLKKR